MRYRQRSLLNSATSPGLQVSVAVVIILVSSSRLDATSFCFISHLGVSVQKSQTQSTDDVVTSVEEGDKKIIKYTRKHCLLCMYWYWLVFLDLQVF